MTHLSTWKVEVNSHGGRTVELGFAKVYDCLDTQWRFCLKNEAGTLTNGYVTAGDAVQAAVASYRRKFPKRSLPLRLADSGAEFREYIDHHIELATAEQLPQPRKGLSSEARNGDGKSRTAKRLSLS